jgi:hypothetical protein
METELPAIQSSRQLQDFRLEMAFMKPGVYAVLFEQLLVIAALHDPAFVDHEDGIRIVDRGQPVRDDERGPPLWTS